MRRPCDNAKGWRPAISNPRSRGRSAVGAPHSALRAPQLRRGLAPLELVLSLPILMMVMALMMVMGTAGAWKVRTQANSREAAWRSLTPRTGSRDANPLGWPDNAEMRWSRGNPPLMPEDPFADQTVVRGPMLAEPGSGQFLPVNTNLLDPAFGVMHGFARIERPFPLLAIMPPHRIDFPREHVIVDATLWQYPTMGIPRNDTRRILFLYNMELETRVPQLTTRYVQAALAIVQNPRQVELSPLEGSDPEIMQLVGQTSPNFPRMYSINVNYRPPRIRQVQGSVPDYCTLESDQVRVDTVEPHKRNIERRLPRHMADYYINVYTAVKQQLEAQLMAVRPGTVPPPGLQQQIDDLQRKIDQLNQFKASLPP